MDLVEKPGTDLVNIDPINISAIWLKI